ncbi:lycopene cyclase domain-containing protein [Pseudobacteriovorax antillogorgiicola]|uniref:Lycopene cyclase domain-containing protein n=1 Tax=Pseudobacteriovorax antillogorgiicola TaxID=1513793 RepID=A0A1Y6BIG3_9BACT|nr:lycopene cyclase domain-containing protein [Pseudobacteriovorax antillogorgiicola]TCS55482.1 lycopene cyclase domain-containing protein [Pseudobacteriovorax antillogorgiicola]SMF11903.1 lycopene cyclase domain-containing protein [Pseudobacteriovorax antillogorgiicola]
MTYLQFLLIFLVPLILLEIWYVRKKFPGQGRVMAAGIGFLSFVAVVYTTPWDNYLVKHKIWWYGPDKVLGVIGYVPIEEYAFFVLQTVLTGLYLYIVRRPFRPESHQPDYSVPRLTGSMVYLLLSILGWIMLFTDSFRYLGLILGWACPVMLLQFSLGGHRLWQTRQRSCFVIATSTLYLCLADALAIGLEIWTISPTFTTGIKFGTLPLEEAIFFLATNIMVVQGLELAWSFWEGWELKLSPTLGWNRSKNSQLSSP